MVRLRPGALLGAGLLLVATVGLVSAAIPSDTGVYSACYETKGGTLHLVDSSVTACPKGQVGPVVWNQAGVPGPAGTSGPEGDPGPQGSPGLLGAVDDINGLPCHNDAVNSAGVAQVVESYYGLKEIACVTGNAALAADTWNSTPLSATAVTIGCGSARVFNGTTVPAGTNDWFKVSFTLAAGCPALHIRIVNGLGGAARFDVTNTNGIKLNGSPFENNGCFDTDVSITSPNPVWIRVWSPYVRSSYTLSIFEDGTATCPNG
jgi:hypothetical protein